MSSRLFVDSRERIERTLPARYASRVIISITTVAPDIARLPSCGQTRAALRLSFVDLDQLAPGVTEDQRFGAEHAIARPSKAQRC